MPDAERLVGSGDSDMDRFTAESLSKDFGLTVKKRIFVSYDFKDFYDFHEMI